MADYIQRSPSSSGLNENDMNFSLTSAGDVRDVGSIPGSGRPLGGENGNPLQYLCLKNPMDRGA